MYVCMCVYVCVYIIRIIYMHVCDMCVLPSGILPLPNSYDTFAQVKEILYGFDMF